jgi:hypothetical protein
MQCVLAQQLIAPGAQESLRCSEHPKFRPFKTDQTSGLQTAFSLRSVSKIETLKERLLLALPMLTQKIFAFWHAVFVTALHFTRPVIQTLRIV